MNTTNILLGISGGLVALLVMAVIKIGFTAWVYSSFNKNHPEKQEH